VKKNKINPTVWIFSEIFFPDETSTGYLFTELALGLSGKFNVKVITATDLHSFGVKSGEKRILPQIETIRLKNLKLNKDRVFQRIVKFAFLSIQFMMAFLLKVKRGDKVILVTNPAPALVGISLTNLLVRAKIVLVVHDVFPENTVAAGLMKPNVPYRSIKKIFDYAYSRFDRLVVLGRDMREIVAQKSKKPERITIIENWADLESLNIEPNSDYNSFGKDLVSILFAGNLGRLQCLPEMVKIIGRYPNLVCLTIVGTGAVEGELKQIVQENQFQNINFLGPFPRESQNRFLNSFDICLVSLNERMYGLGVPSKTYNILAVGKPILYFGPSNSEIDKLVREKELGWSSNSLEEFEDILGRISKKEVKVLDPKKIREVALNNFSKGHFIRKFTEVLDTI
jgi:hypothetical protein